MLRKLLSTAELSNRTGLSAYTIRKLAKLNRLPTVPAVTGRLRFDPATVARVLADGEAGRISVPNAEASEPHTAKG